MKKRVQRKMNPWMKKRKKNSQSAHICCNLLRYFFRLQRREYVRKNYLTYGGIKITLSGFASIEY